jgi:DNA-binding transcriptional LysR family regulator
VELRQLRYFLAVAESQSFRLAAERINVTQPAITRQIQDLETMLGARLFDRTPQGVKLTVAGQLFLPEVRKSLGILESAMRAVKLVASGLQGSVRLGVVENASWDGLVPDAFSRFQSEAPEVSTHVAPLNTPEQVAEILAGTLDGGFIYTYGELPRALSVLQLAVGDVVAAVPRSWNLPDNQAISVRDLNGRPMICFPRQTYPSYYDMLVGACSEAGLTLDVVQEVPTEAAILSLVSAGLRRARSSCVLPICRSQCRWRLRTSSATRTRHCSACYVCSTRSCIPAGNPPRGSGVDGNPQFHQGAGLSSRP